MSETQNVREIYEPFEASGVDPEIDMKATEAAFFDEDAAAERSGGGRRLSEALMEFAGHAAEAFGEGARHIDLSDRYKDE